MGKRPFGWGMIFYFANRYLQLASMICFVILVSTRRDVNCHAFYAMIEFMGFASAGLANINLSIRTVAIWDKNRYIVGGLVLVILGHWALIFQGVQPKFNWQSGVGCVPIKADNRIVSAIFIYSMCFDLMILLLNAYKLLSRPSPFSMSGGKYIAHMMFIDGLIFFLIAFLFNFTATVFLTLNLNQTMNHIFNVPASIFSTIVACRAIRQLKTFNDTLAADSISILSPGPPKPSWHGNKTMQFPDLQL